VTDAELIAEIVPLLRRSSQDCEADRECYQETLLGEILIPMRRKDVKPGVPFLPPVGRSRHVTVFDEKRADELLEKLWASPYRPDMAFALSVAAREFLSEGIPLPPTLRFFTMSLLESIGEGPRFNEGKLRYAVNERNARIVEAVRHLRNTHKVGGRRARSLIVRALEKTGTYITEDAIRKVLLRRSHGSS
jgi:hypothetical protein